MKPPYDHKIAYAATAIDQCIKLGGVVLKPGGQAGFSAPPTPPRPPGE